MKIIHCADLHLGSRIDSSLQKISEDRRTEVRASFTHLVDYAKENDIHVILLSGDVFDSDAPLKKDKDFFYSVVRGNPEIDFLYLRGNHDSSELNVCEYDNLKTFGFQWKAYSYDDVVISGIEMCPENASSYYSSLTLDPANFNIVMLHGQVADSVGMDKIRIQSLKGKGIDYLALGHIHSYSCSKIDDRGIYAYSGCLEGRGFDETGEKGFVVVEIQNKHLTTKFVPHSIRVIREVEADVSGADGILSVIDRVKEKLIWPKSDIYRVKITGNVPYSLEITPADITSHLLGYYYLEARISTKTEIDLASFMHDMSLKGEFIRTVSENPDLSDEEKTEVLSLGLRVLDGSEVEF